MKLEKENKNAKSESRAILTIGFIFILVFMGALYLLLYPSIKENEEVEKEFETIKEYYLEQEEIVDYIKSTSTGVGYEYKAYFPDGSIHYIELDDKDVNIVLEIEEAIEWKKGNLLQ